MADSQPEVLRRLVGVYDADGTWRGEVAYWIGARLGRTHCALCEITHSPFREKSAWKSCSEGMPVPFDTVHRDEQPSALAAVTAGAVPCVVAETDRRLVVLLDERALESCGGEPEALASAIEAAVAGQSSRGRRRTVFALNEQVTLGIRLEPGASLARWKRGSVAPTSVGSPP